MLEISKLRAPKNRVIVKIIGTQEAYSNGIIIPGARKNTSHEALVVSVGKFDENNEYFDVNAQRRQKNILKIGDVVLLSFNSEISNFEALDEKGNLSRYITITPETVNAIYRDGVYQREL